MQYNVGTRRELFVDGTLVQSFQGTRLVLQKPERRETVLELDAPWENNVSFPYRVLPFKGGWRMYYRASILDLSREEDTCVTAVAESDDGVSFRRPSLGVCEFAGSRQNNILQIGGFPNTPPPFFDTRPGCPPGERFKGIAARQSQAFAMVSGDGVRWRLLHNTPMHLRGQFDTVNTAFWDELAGCYRSYTRSWHDPETGAAFPTWDFGGVAAVRAIQHARSEDFLNWTEPEQLQYADGDRTVHLYTNAIVPCPEAEHILLGFPSRFVPDRTPDESHGLPGVNDALFMTSRDGVHWNRWLDAWVSPGLDPLNWTERNNYPVWGIAKTSPTEWSMYISEHYRHEGVPTRVRRLSIRPWGFVAVHADYSGGELVTKPLVFEGTSLSLNARTSAAGAIRVEIQDETGHAIPAFSLAEMRPWYGDSLDARMAWGENTSLGSLRGRPIRLRFWMKDADVFSFRFPS